MKKFRVLTFLALALIAVLVVAGCQQQAETVEVTRIVTETETVTEEVPVEVTRVVEVAAEPSEKVVVEFWTTDNEVHRIKYNFS